MSIRNTIESVRRRQAFLLAFEALQVLLAYGLGLFILWISAARLLGIPSPTFGLCLWLLCVIVVASGIVGWVRRPDVGRCAWLLDKAVDSQNLFGTLLDLPEDDSPVRQHLESQAEAAAAALHLPVAFPALCNRTGKWLWLPATLLILTLFLPAKDPFGWRDQRLRQQMRDRAVAAAETSIDAKLADPALSPEAREILEQTKEELAASLGEQEVAATLAQMAEAAAASGDNEALEAMQTVLQEAAEAAGTESAVAAAASAANAPKNQLAGKEQTASSDTDPSTKPTDPNNKNPDGKVTAGKPQDGETGAKPSETNASNSSQNGKPGEPGKPGDGDASQASTNAKPGEAGGKPKAGSGKPGKPGDAQAGAPSSGGPGSGGIGDGGGQAANGGTGPVAFRDLMVNGKRINDHTIEELIRIADDDADNAAEKRIFIRAKTAAAANATATMSRTRVPADAAASVRGYFEALAKPE